MTRWLLALMIVFLSGCGKDLGPDLNTVLCKAGLSVCITTLVGVGTNSITTYVIKDDGTIASSTSYVTASGGVSRNNTAFHPTLYKIYSSNMATDATTVSELSTERAISSSTTAINDTLPTNAIHPQGVAFYIGNSTTNNLDVHSMTADGGIGATVQSVAIPGSPAVMSFDATKTILATAYSSGFALYRASETDGTLSLLSSDGNASSGSNVVFHPTQQVLYTRVSATNSIKAYTYDLSGNVTLLGTTAFTSFPVIYVHPDLRAFYVNDSDALEVYSYGSGGRIGSRLQSVTRSSGELAFSTDGSVLYSPGSEGIRVYKISADGTLTQVQTYSSAATSVLKMFEWAL